MAAKFIGLEDLLEVLSSDGEPSSDAAFTAFARRLLSKAGVDDCGRDDCPIHNPSRENGASLGNVSDVNSLIALKLAVDAAAASGIALVNGDLKSADALQKQSGIWSDLHGQLAFVEGAIESDYLVNPMPLSEIIERLKDKAQPAETEETNPSSGSDDE